MRRICRLSAHTVALLAGWLLASGVASACNVPVFRYALEHWRPDPYRLTVFHRGPLDTTSEAHLAALQDQKVNAVVRVIDADNVTDDADRTLLASFPSSQLPRLVVQYPSALGIEQPVWSAGLNADAITTLLNSPVRRELVRRLAEGETAVWVLLETGDAPRDKAAAATLTEELKALSRKLKLPELTESPEDVLLGSTPLKVSFSLLHVSRDDSAESALVAMLLGCEPDLAMLDEPMAFPVFGRNRVLLPLVGEGITADNIHTSAAFLTGACSCQVKNQNPGFDLLHTADWAAALLLDHDPAVTIAEAIPSEPELVPIPSGVGTPTPATNPAAVPATGAVAAAPVARQLSFMTLAGGALAVAACFWLVLNWRS